MEAKQLGPTKRKRSWISSNPFAGTLTRSKSQVLVHRNRSGRRRPDSFHREDPLSRFKPVEPPTASDGRCYVVDVSHILIKDLRVRRVFSPSEISVPVEDELSPKARKLTGTNPDLSSIDEKAESGNRLDAENVAEVEVSEQFDMEISTGEISDGIGERHEEEFVQATPLDPEIAVKLHKGECEFRVEGSVPINPPNDGLKIKEGLAGSISRNKSALKRLKLYKPADSFSYRRLLPYLMGMENDSSCSLPGGQSLSHHKVLEDKLVHQPLAANKHEPLLDTCNADKSVADCRSSKNGSNKLLNGSEENLTPMEIISDSSMPFVSNVRSLAYDDSCVKTPTNGGMAAFARDQSSVTHTDDDKNEKDSLNEEPVQFTPPDATIAAKPKADETESSREECGLLGSETSLEKSSSEKISRHNITLHDKRKQSSFKSLSVLKQCTRPKIFRNPGSFSYRRLLPYLMNVAKENSCDSGSNQFPNINGCLEEKPLQQFNGSDCKHTADSSGSSCRTDQTASGSTNNSEPNVSSPENIKVSVVSFDSEGAMQTVDAVKSDADPKLETETSTTLSICENLTSIVIHGSSSDEGANLTLGGSRSSTPAEAMSMLQTSSCFDMSVPLGNSSLASLKGILKRNPRGCRGLCTCLHCSSFRLNAEKAFEFSRNQMQDTEELTYDLINELANLRNILEKCGGSADTWVNQVKEACRKASEAEEAAKQRLGQMNDDLNVHSRIRCSQPPRVRFTNHIEENAIPNAELPSNS